MAIWWHWAHLLPEIGIHLWRDGWGNERPIAIFTKVVAKCPYQSVDTALDRFQLRLLKPVNPGSLFSSANGFFYPVVTFIRLPEETHLLQNVNIPVFQQLVSKQATGLNQYVQVFVIARQEQRKQTSRRLKWKIRKQVAATTNWKIRRSRFYRSSIRQLVFWFF